MTKELPERERGPVVEPPMSVEEVARLTNLQVTFRHVAKLLKVEPSSEVDPAGD